MLIRAVLLCLVMAGLIAASAAHAEKNVQPASEIAIVTIDDERGFERCSSVDVQDQSGSAVWLVAATDEESTTVGSEEGDEENLEEEAESKVEEEVESKLECGRCVGGYQVCRDVVKGKPLSRRCK